MRAWGSSPATAGRYLRFRRRGASSACCDWLSPRGSEPGPPWDAALVMKTSRRMVASPWESPTIFAFVTVARWRTSPACNSAAHVARTAAFLARTAIRFATISSSSAARGTRRSTVFRRAWESARADHRRWHGMPRAGFMPAACAGRAGDAADDRRRAQAGQANRAPSTSGTPWRSPSQARARLHVDGAFGSGRPRASLATSRRWARPRRLVGDRRAQVAQRPLRLGHRISTCIETMDADDAHALTYIAIRTPSRSLFTDSASSSAARACPRLRRPASL